MYDCWTLIQEMDDYNIVSDIYFKVSDIELQYRGLKIKPKNCLIDTIESCICIIGRGAIRPEDYTYLKAGIRGLQGHLFDGLINGENAVSYASEVMYLATCLLTEQKEYDKISDPGEYQNVSANIKDIRKISGIRKTNPLAYAYLVKSIQMLDTMISFDQM